MAIQASSTSSVWLVKHPLHPLARPKEAVSRDCKTGEKRRRRIPRRFSCSSRLGFVGLIPRDLDRSSQVERSPITKATRVTGQRPEQIIPCRLPDSGTRLVRNVNNPVQHGERVADFSYGCPVPGWIVVGGQVNQCLEAFRDLRHFDEGYADPGGGGEGQEDVQDGFCCCYGFPETFDSLGTETGVVQDGDWGVGLAAAESIPYGELNVPGMGLREACVIEKTSATRNFCGSKSRICSYLVASSYPKAGEV